MKQMHKFIYLLWLLFLGFGNKTKAQYTMHPKLHAGYVYQNHSFGELGVRFLFLKKDEVLYRIGASALVGDNNGKIGVLPKLQGDILFNFRENVMINHSYYYLVGADVTSQYIAPKVGISVLGILDFSAGYGWSYPNLTFSGKTLQGLHLNFSLNVPLVVFSKN